MDIVRLEDKKYPKLLKKIGKDAPKRLYYKGEWPFGAAQGENNIFRNCLAVVGSRQMTIYGRQVAERIVSEVAAAGVTIVSGFMYGVDAAAHKAALSVSKGRTIAVMPCGIDLIHPEYQQDLYAEILENKGLIISEYEGNFAPTLWTYPRRNRIVAGLAKAVLVIEAGEKSGSLITANFARKFKRKLFVIPGPITSENSKGIMELLKQGATPVSSAKDILDYFDLRFSARGSSFSSSLSQPSAGSLRVPKNLNPSLQKLEQKIIDLLKRESLEIDVLARTFEMPVSKLGTTLSLMQLKGFIKQEGNKYYAG